MMQPQPQIQQAPAAVESTEGGVSEETLSL